MTKILTLCLVSVLSVLVPLPSAASHQESAYDHQLSFGIQDVTIGSADVFFLGFVNADDFFNDIVKTTRSDGITFSKQGAQVEYFPDVLSIELRVYVPRLRRKTRKGQILDPSPEFMRSLRFRPEWKRDMELRQVEGFSFPKVTREAGPIDSIREQWIYNFTISGKKVPLTDHLIVTVLSDVNKPLLRMSASL